MIQGNAGGTGATAEGAEGRPCDRANAWTARDARPGLRRSLPHDQHPHGEDEGELHRDDRWRRRTALVRSGRRSGSRRSGTTGRTALAVGIISTSRGPGDTFPATWDFVHVFRGHRHRPIGLRAADPRSDRRSTSQVVAWHPPSTQHTPERSVMAQPRTSRARRNRTPTDGHHLTTMTVMATLLTGTPASAADGAWQDLADAHVRSPGGVIRQCRRQAPPRRRREDASRLQPGQRHLEHQGRHAGQGRPCAGGDHGREALHDRRVEVLAHGDVGTV